MSSNSIPAKEGLKIQTHEKFSRPRKITKKLARLGNEILLYQILRWKKHAPV